MSTQFITPVGRLVQGDAHTPQATDSEGKPLVVKSGPNAGQPAKKWFIALAITKDNPEFPAFWAQVQSEAKTAFPQYFNPQG